jgi:hypothetical protein
MAAVCTSTALSVGTTPSSPTAKPSRRLDVCVTSDDVVAQNTMLPPASAGAIEKSP